MTPGQPSHLRSKETGKVHDHWSEGVAMPQDTYFDDAPVPEPERADLVESVVRLAQFFDGLSEKQQAAYVRAFLRVNLFDRRTLHESAALAGCSRSTLLRAETVLKRILKPSL